MNEKVKTADYKQVVKIETYAANAFEALTRQIDKWWGDMDSIVLGKNDIFKVSWGEPWYQFKVAEYEPNKKITWECIDANQIIGGLEGVEKEWVGTKLHWQIEEIKEDVVQVSMTHEGLVPDFICYDVCSNAWDHFITGALKNYLEQS